MTFIQHFGKDGLVLGFWNSQRSSWNMRNSSGLHTFLVTLQHCVSFCFVHFITDSKKRKIGLLLFTAAVITRETRDRMNYRVSVALYNVTSNTKLIQCTMKLSKRRGQECCLCGDGVILPPVNQSSAK